MWKEYITATSVDEAVRHLGEKGTRARIVAGATDLILELERGVRRDIDTLIDITRIPDLDRITLDEQGVVHLGAMVTHNQCVASSLIRDRAFPLARAAWEVGAPQIRNRATVAGNLITASPANDTITPLMSLGARVTLASPRGQRTVALDEFYKGVRQTIMEPDEMLVDIAFQALGPDQKGTFIKLALRRAQAISVINVSAVLELEDSSVVRSAAITLGAVAPTIIHAEEAERFLAGKKINDKVISRAANLAMEASRPIDDIRGSAAYRREMVRVCTARGLTALTKGLERESFPDNPVLLWGQTADTKANSTESITHRSDSVIRTRINGRDFEFKSGADKTLLRLLREEGNLTGTKEGCAEGECGACTVFLDGKAVMACLVPAPRAHGAEILTIEGLGTEEHLHPVQQAFIHYGAVQCGYCTPGFIMSSAKLLEERPKPTPNEIEQAITGNLCRCTGYYKIVEAIENASNFKT